MTWPLTQNKVGAWVPAIPEPFWSGWGLRRARCACGRAFWSLEAYRGHYALKHIVDVATRVEVP